MAASTVPAVKTRLKEIFAAAVEPSTEVWRNRTNEEHQTAENVYVGDARGERKFQSVGAGLAKPPKREEIYTITVEVEVTRQGTDAVGTEERLWAIVTQLENAAGQDLKLGVGEVQWSLIGLFSQSSQADGEGWFCGCSFGVQVTARI